MKYIVYRTTCLINNKIYVGVHHTDDPNIFDGYMDSFKTVKEAREKLGLKLCSISQAVKLGRQCNGFRWTRTDSPTPTI